MSKRNGQSQIGERQGECSEPTIFILEDILYNLLQGQRVFFFFLWPLAFLRNRRSSWKVLANKKLDHKVLVPVLKMCNYAVNFRKRRYQQIRVSGMYHIKVGGSKANRIYEQKTLWIRTFFTVRSRNIIKTAAIADISYL